MPNDKEPPTRNWRKRVSYYVPVTAWVPGYSWSLYVLSQFIRLHSAVERTGSSPSPELMEFSLGF